jgi:hypothetical protein
MRDYDQEEWVGLFVYSEKRQHDLGVFFRLGITLERLLANPRPDRPESSCLPPWKPMH